MSEAKISPRILVQRLLPAAQMPRYAHTGPYGDLAADLFAAEAATLAPVGEPGSTLAVRTGLALELPSSHGATARGGAHPGKLRRDRHARRDAARTGRLRLHGNVTFA